MSFHETNTRLFIFLANIMNDEHVICDTDIKNNAVKEMNNSLRSFGGKKQVTVILGTAVRQALYFTFPFASIFFNIYECISSDCTKSIAYYIYDHVYEDSISVL